MATATKAKILTARGIEALDSDPVARREIPDGGAAGLFIVVQPSGAKSWAVRYRHEGRPRKLTLGAWPKMGLATARRATEAALATVAEGGDPAADKIEAKRTAKIDADPDRDLVRGVAAEFLKRHASRNRTGAETRRTLEKEVLPIWGARRMDAITRRDVLDLLDGIVDRGAPVQANRVLACVRKLFNWAASRDVVAASPCAGVRPPTPETKRDRVLSDDEIRWFWRATAGMGWPFCPMLRLLLITGQRLSEVAQMTRREIDGAVWTIPAARAKNGKAHAVPLSVPALLTVASSPTIASTAGFIFTTTGDNSVSGFASAKTRVAALMLAQARAGAEAAGADPEAVEIPRWTFHDLRRTCASGMARCGVNLPVIERVLNHVSGSFGGAAGIYNRHSYADEMRRALDVWGAHLLAVVDHERGDNVVMLRGAV